METTVSTATPKVSVIMNCYNSDKYLREAIESVYAQTFKDWEIVFWDNASSDLSASIAKSFDQRLRYLQSPVTLPLGEARNKAINEALGHYLAFIDCDDLWHSEKIAKQVAFLDNNESHAMVFTNTVKFHDDHAYLDFDERHAPPSGQIFKQLLRRNFITLSSVMCRCRSLKALGILFDPRFHISEDWELWLRLSFSSLVGYLSEPLTKWRINPNSMTHKKFSLYAVETKMIIDMLKKMDTQIELEFAKEIQALHNTAHFHHGLGLWFEGRAQEARQVFRPHLRQNGKFMLAYLASFFPHRLIKFWEQVYFRLRLHRFLAK